MDVWNWCRHAWNQGGIIISIYDISLIQFLFCKNTINLKECVAAIALLLYKKHHSWKKWLHLKLRINSIPFKKRWLQVLAQRITVTWKLLDRCKWPSEIGNWNICQIYCIYSIHGCGILLKNTVSIEEWLAATTFLKQRSTVRWGKLFLLD